MTVVNWTTALNWSTNDAIVRDLGADTDIIVYAGFGTLGNAGHCWRVARNYYWFVCN